MFRWVLGIVLVLTLTGAAGYYILNQDRLACDLCSRHLHSETTFQIHLSDGSTLDACCPRCGLRYVKENPEVASSEVADFRTGEFVASDAAYYLEGSAAHTCAHDLTQRDATGILYTVVWDRCLPGLIAFKEKPQAEQFMKENGGSLKTYSQLLEGDL